MKISHVLRINCARSKLAVVPDFTIDQELKLISTCDLVFFSGFYRFASLKLDIYLLRPHNLVHCYIIQFFMQIEYLKSFVEPIQKDDDSERLVMNTSNTIFNITNRGTTHSPQSTHQKLITTEGPIISQLFYKIPPKLSHLNFLGWYTLKM